ncbi:MAG: flagellar biosynthetic protein FliP [SAR86 cluster bacterium]|uniref:Flagellar biosynthetic protein FliP n=1 Tax=SAR86 cluster bacterium TaxID=2030880 RepID=A0A2A5B566_9GAMM|nr:MAG: flagellar biosynthetic protein FliP [SAR86 cluster bacterium]
MRKVLLTLFLASFLMPELAYAADEGITLVTSQEGANGQASYSISLQILLFMTMLSMLPAALMTMTSFTRIVIVLGILRQALGMMQTPSNQIIIGIALFTTFFIMSPVFEAAYQNGIEPYMEESIEFDEALLETGIPFHGFMTNQARDSDVALFAEMAGYESFESVDEIPFRVLIPAYITSELKTAFQIGFLIFIPFLVIDLVVSSILMSMGMMMLSPMLISLPFKIMLFVLVDGWTLVMGTLAASFFV